MESFINDNEDFVVKSEVCQPKRQDWILKREVNFFGKLLPEGTVFKQVNGDYYRPIVKGNRCPSYQVDFYIVKNNPDYFVPFSDDLKQAFEHKKTCIKMLNILKSEGGSDLAVMVSIGNNSSFGLCDNQTFAQVVLSNEIFQADMFIAGDPKSKF